MNNVTNDRKPIVVTWPQSFTIKELQDLNPDVKNITLRFRLNKSIGSGEISQIGKKSVGVGRPVLVFTKTPVTQDTLLDVMSKGCQLDEQYNKSVVAKVDNSANVSSNDLEESDIHIQHEVSDVQDKVSV